MKQYLLSTPFLHMQKLETLQLSLTLPAAQKNVGRLLTFARLTPKLRPSYGTASATTNLSTMRVILLGTGPLYGSQGFPRSFSPSTVCSGRKGRDWRHWIMMAYKGLLCGALPR